MWATEAPLPALPLALPLAPCVTELFANLSVYSLDHRRPDSLGPGPVTPQLWLRIIPIRRLKLTATFTADTEIDDGLSLAKIEYSPTIGCHSVALPAHLIQNSQAAVARDRHCHSLPRTFQLYHPRISPIRKREESGQTPKNRIHSIHQFLIFCDLF
jgi:hypothetical protein